LQAYGLTIADIASSLSSANVLTAVGRLEDHDKLYLVVSDTRMTNPQQIGETVLKSGANGVVRLADVATIQDSSVPQWTRTTADGHEAVLLQVYQQPAGNTVEINRQIKQKLRDIKGQIPNGVKIANWYDQGQLIIASAGSVRDAVLIGIGLAALVLLLFLRNWKITLVATLAVPAVLATTVLMLYVLGMTFNIMTLGGMAAAVGLIIDDTIVMVEHIVRRLRGKDNEMSSTSSGLNGVRGRIARATHEFTSPLVGSSFSTIIIFIPLAFLSGVTGAFFKALSLTMAAGLIISFLVAWLAVPVLSAGVLGQKDIEQNEHGPITEWFHRGYEWIMRWALKLPLLAILAMVPLAVIGYFCYQNVGSGFLPSMDEGGFTLDYVTPPGTSLAETDRLLRKIEGILQTTPEVQTYSRRTGLQLGGGLTEANTGDFFVRLKPFPRRPIEDVMSNVRRRIEKNVPGIDVELSQLMEDLIGDLTAVPQPIEIKIFSDDQKTLDTLAPKIADKIQRVKGVVEVLDGIVPAGDALEIHISRVKAALEGMAPGDITDTINDYLSGTVATQMIQGPKTVGVRIWVPMRVRTTAEDIGKLLIRAPNGHLFPLSRVATFQTVTGQPEIDRENLKRMVAVTARIEGRDMGSTVAEVKKLLDQPGTFPPGVYYTLGGLYHQQQIAFHGLIVVIVSAVMLVFLLLLFLYESFRVAFAMLTMPILAMGAVFVGLWLTGTELNITAMMGMTMIVGIVTEVAIFYYSEYHDLPTDMDVRQRMIEAGKNRMRPIAMTTVAAILALLPLALALGQGAAMQQPLAIAIISGLVVQLPLVLIVLPAILVILGITRRDKSPLLKGTSNA
ncbi:MAG TPA: efflux RND transporter permease subunit, partial [Tepidisphaeraceae bacterium]|nr:efflux RND transporter permease subunit [Tepidisphaeraceae bacterium]